MADVVNAPFGGVYRDRTVLVTGHTGFKGSWLTSWLVDLGAKVVGFSLPEPPTEPSNFVLSGLAGEVEDVRADIRDPDAVAAVVARYQPEAIFHLAAMPIVLRSATEPHYTIHTNALGTTNLLEAVRRAGRPTVLVSITTDKVYRDQGWTWGYRETDELGGSDPYSASKAMAELAVRSYRATFFPPAALAEHGVAVATVRAGNVIGGGDMADFRLVPDIARALVAGEPVGLRAPESVRPWQHVLEPLSGYLWLAARMLRDPSPDLCDAWNFGPLEVRGVPARDIADRMIELWGSGSWFHADPHAQQKVETALLRLSWEKAAMALSWRPVYAWHDALAEIVSWWKAYERGEDLRQVGRQHIAAYVDRARELGLGWSAAEGTEQRGQRRLQ